MFSGQVTTGLGSPLVRYLNTILYAYLVTSIKPAQTTRERRYPPIVASLSYDAELMTERYLSYSSWSWNLFHYDSVMNWWLTQEAILHTPTNNGQLPPVWSLTVPGSLLLSDIYQMTNSLDSFLAYSPPYPKELPAPREPYLHAVHRATEVLALFTSNQLFWYQSPSTKGASDDWVKNLQSITIYHSRYISFNQQHHNLSSTWKEWIQSRAVKCSEW